MADQQKVQARSYEPWCGHDNNRTAYNDCRECWMKIKRQQRKKARLRMKNELPKLVDSY